MTMSYKIFLATVMALAVSAGFAQVDDMYFIPQKEEPKKASTVVVTYEPQHAEDNGDDVLPPGEEPVYASGEVRDVDEYNRRGIWANDAAEDSLAGEDSTEVAARGALDSGDDYECSKRILRFCTPTIGVAVSSPLYWDLCYGPNAIYWDVYDDGVYAYAFPSSWSTFYWGPYYSWGWGWPYYSYWGWGGPWYAGWHDPWYWRPHWHHPHWGHPGGGHPGRPVARPSLTHRTRNSFTRNGSRRNGAMYSRTRLSRNNGGGTWQRNSSRSPIYRSNRPSTTTRQSARGSRSTYGSSYMPSVRGNSFSPSSPSRSTFRQSSGSPSRSGGFSPSRGGSARSSRR